MIYLNKWCPIIQTENSQTKCMNDQCALWNDEDKNCNINVIADKLKEIENNQ